jgi:hypothetical protein
MYDENEPNDESQAQRSTDPAVRAKDKSDELRMAAELFAIFEGCRKFDAQILPGFDPQLAREVQQTIGKLEKSKAPDSPILPEASIADATKLLNLPTDRDLSTNDYHVQRRPGEVMIARWLAGEQVGTFYQRLQAHFDAALDGFKEDQRQAHEWKHDQNEKAYLAALDTIEVRMPERYLRDSIRQHNLFVLSTQTADEINIAYLSDYVMGVSADEIVGSQSAPPADPTETDLAWFFKLFSLRALIDNKEHMCFFAYLQKTDDSFDW